MKLYLILCLCLLWSLSGCLINELQLACSLKNIPMSDREEQTVTCCRLYVALTWFQITAGKIFSLTCLFIAGKVSQIIPWWLIKQERFFFKSCCFYVSHHFTFFVNFFHPLTHLLQFLFLFWIFLPLKPKTPWRHVKFDESHAVRDDKSHRRRDFALHTSTKGSYLHTTLFISAMGLVFFICGLLLKASLKIQGLFSMYLITVIFNIKSLWAATAIIKSVLCQSSLLILTLLKTSPLGCWEWIQLTGLFVGRRAKKIIALCRHDPICLFERFELS